MNVKLPSKKLLASSVVILALIQYTLVGLYVHHGQHDHGHGQGDSNNGSVPSQVHDLHKIASDSLALPRSNGAVRTGVRKKVKKGQQQPQIVVKQPEAKKKKLGGWARKIQAKKNMKKKQQQQQAAAASNSLLDFFSLGGSKPKKVRRHPQLNDNNNNNHNNHNNPANHDNQKSDDTDDEVEPLDEEPPRPEMPLILNHSIISGLANGSNQSHQLHGNQTRMNTFPLKIQPPVFVASLPKSGTTSIWQYFQCGGHKANHQWFTDPKTGNSTQTGKCIRDNVVAHRPPFDKCGDFDIYTDTGFANYEHQQSECYYPSVDALEAIVEHYPRATILLVVRNTTQWYKSMQAWGKGSLLDRWRPCNATHFPSFTARQRDFEQFYEWHTEHLRNFCQRHPSLNLIEVPLESPETGQILEDRIGIPSTCWAKCTPTSRLCEPVAQHAKT